MGGQRIEHGKHLHLGAEARRGERRNCQKNKRTLRMECFEVQGKRDVKKWSVVSDTDVRMSIGKRPLDLPQGQSHDLGALGESVKSKTWLHRVKA